MQLTFVVSFILQKPHLTGATGASIARQPVHGEFSVCLCDEQRIRMAGQRRPITDKQDYTVLIQEVSVIMIC